MNRALGDIPLTIKMRTGVKEGRNTAHKLMPRISAEWNVGAMTVSPTQLLPLSCAIRASPDPDPISGRSCTGGRDNSGTQSWQIGTTSENASMPFAHVKQRKTVRIHVFTLSSIRFGLFNSGADAHCQCHGSLSSVVATPSPRKTTGPRLRAVALTAS
jgi:hypothetical protein